MMALAAANSPRNQARMASLAKESETSIGGGRRVGRSEGGGVGPAAMELGCGVIGANGVCVGPKSRLKRR